MITFENKYTSTRIFQEIDLKIKILTEPKKLNYEKPITHTKSYLKTIQSYMLKCLHDSCYPIIENLDFIIIEFQKDYVCNKMDPT